MNNNKLSIRPAPLMYDPRFPPPLPGASQTPFLVSGSWIPKGQGEATPTSDVTHSIATHKTMAHSAQVKGFKALRTQAPVFVPTTTIKNGEYISANSKEEKVNCFDCLNTIFCCCYVIAFKYPVMLFVGNFFNYSLPYLF